MLNVHLKLRRILTILISLAAIVAAVWAIVQSVILGETRAASTVNAQAAAPDFEAVTAEGRQVRLSDYRGQVVLINFWASWCKACVTEMPLIQDVSRARSGEMTALMVNVGDSKGTISEYMNSRNFTFPVIIDVTGRISGLYGIAGLPATFIIDKTGTMRKTVMGEITDQEQLNTWLDAAIAPEISM
ncbi:TlpA family protein disulfide reductase [Paenibacillus sp. NPDC057934]|uniref:TlpA family protein disulfide reductase n=1 Tax=Paenibacillus sp. NPDC057934 TaxID=3346282 RepID=UPI0036DCABC5